MKENLIQLLVRLGRDHPFHILYQLLSLKNGDRNMQGRPERTTAASRKEAMKQKVDPDKIQAAANVIDQIAEQSNRYCQLD